jgi:hypothetical protein
VVQQEPSANLAMMCLQMKTGKIFKPHPEVLPEAATAGQAEVHLKQ